MKPSDYIRIGWCQMVFARDAHGHPVNSSSGDAVSWCAEGAMCAARLPDKKHLAMWKATIKVIEGRGGKSVNVWNDHPSRTQAEVIAVLEAAEKEIGL